MPEAAPIPGHRVAFFGGSFDPPHAGHLAIARAAQQSFALDAVLFAPVGAQPLKPLGSTAPYEDRVVMTELAIADEPGFSVSLVDAPTPNGAPNYTIDTLQKLRSRMVADADLYCLMGADSLHGLRRWHRAEEIPFTASLIVASRPGESLENLASLLPKGLTFQTFEPAHSRSSEPLVLSYMLTNMSGMTTPFYVLPGLHVDISASQIRASLQDKAEAKPILLPEVASYIASHHLYTGGQ